MNFQIMSQTTITMKFIGLILLIIFAKTKQDSCTLESKPILAVDFGTTNLCMAVINNGTIEVIANEYGYRTTPAYVAFTQEYEILVGAPAMNKAAYNPENTLYEIKKILGGKSGDGTFNDDIKELTYEVIEKEHEPYVRLSTHKGIELQSLIKITSFLFRKMKETAEKYLGRKLKVVKIARPYNNNFGEDQVKALMEASFRAGFARVYTIEEPLAALIAYGIGKNGLGMTLVIHIGGSTFKYTLLNSELKVIMDAFGEDKTIGGKLFSKRVVNHYIKIYKARGFNITKFKGAIQKLEKEVENAKIQLSTKIETRINIRSLYEGKDFSEILTRDKFEELNMDLFESIMENINLHAMKLLDLNKSDLSNIILVGGSTRIPKLQRMIKDSFKDSRILYGINPEEVVAIGAARQIKDDLIELEAVNSFESHYYGYKKASS